MDLSLIKVKIDNKKKYKLEELDADLKLMFNNCFVYNESGSVAYQVTYLLNVVLCSDLLSCQFFFVTC